MGTPDVRGRACLRQGWAYRGVAGSGGSMGPWLRAWAVLTASDLHFFTGAGLEEHKARVPLLGAACEALGREQVVVEDRSGPVGNAGVGSPHGPHCAVSAEHARARSPARAVLYRCRHRYRGGRWHCTMAPPPYILRR